MSLQSPSHVSKQQQFTKRKIQGQHHFLDKLLSLMPDIDTVIVIHIRGEGASEMVRSWMMHFNL